MSRERKTASRYRGKRTIPANITGIYIQYGAKTTRARARIVNGMRMSVNSYEADAPDVSYSADYYMLFRVGRLKRDF